MPSEIAIFAFEDTLYYIQNTILHSTNCNVHLRLVKRWLEYNYITLIYLIIFEIHVRTFMIIWRIL